MQSVFLFERIKYLMESKTDKVSEETEALKSGTSSKSIMEDIDDVWDLGTENKCESNLVKDNDIILKTGDIFDDVLGYHEPVINKETKENESKNNKPDENKQKFAPTDNKKKKKKNNRPSVNIKSKFDNEYDYEYSEYDDMYM